MSVIQTTTSTTQDVCAWGHSEERRLAVPFTADVTGTIATVSFRTRKIGSPAAMNASIWSDSSGSPGSIIGSASGSLSPTTEGSYTATFGTPVSVTNGTAYWVVFDSASSSYDGSNFYSGSGNGASAEGHQVKSHFNNSSWQVDYPSTTLNTTITITPPSTDVTVSSSVLAATFSLPATTVTATKNVSVASSVVSATFSLPAATVTGTATVSPSVLSATFSIPAVNVQIPNVTVSPSVLSLTASIPTATVATDWVQAVSALVATFSIPTSSVSVVANQTISPSVLALTFSLPTPSRVGGLWTNQSRTGAATLSNQARVTSTWDNQDRVSS